MTVLMRLGSDMSSLPSAEHFVWIWICPIFLVDPGVVNCMHFQWTAWGFRITKLKQTVQSGQDTFKKMRYLWVQCTVFTGFCSPHIACIDDTCLVPEVEKTNRTQQCFILGLPFPGPECGWGPWGRSVSRLLWKSVCCCRGEGRSFTFWLIRKIHCNFETFQSGMCCFLINWSLKPGDVPSHHICHLVLMREAGWG